MSTLGQKIKYLRKEKRLTQSELVGDRITRNQLSMIEKGTAKPSIGTLEYIAERLEKPVYYLLSDEEYTMDECQDLIAKSTVNVEKNETKKAIKDIEAFLNKIKDIEKFPNKDVLGKIYTILGIAYYKDKNENAEKVLKDALEHLNKEKSPMYVSKCLNGLSAIAYDEKRYEDMERYVYEANALLKDITIDTVILKLDVLHNLVLAYTMQGDYSQAVPFINEALGYSKKYEIYRNFGEFNMLLALSYTNSKNYNDAIKQNTKAVEYFTLKDDATNKHRCYSNIGALYRRKFDFDNSMKYFDMAVQYFEDIHDAEKTTNIKAERLKTLFYIDKDSEVLLSDVETLIHSEKLSETNRLDLLIVLGVLVLEQEKPEAALEHFTEAESLLEKYKESELEIYIYKGLSKIYKKLSVIDKALYYLEKAQDMRILVRRDIKYNA